MHQKIPEVERVSYPFPVSTEQKGMIRTLAERVYKTREKWRNRNPQAVELDDQQILQIYLLDKRVTTIQGLIRKLFRGMKEYKK